MLPIRYPVKKCRPVPECRPVKRCHPVKQYRPGKNQKENIWVYFTTTPRPAVVVASVNCDSL